MAAVLHFFTIDRTWAWIVLSGNIVLLLWVWWRTNKTVPGMRTWRTALLIVLGLQIGQHLVFFVHKYLELRADPIGKYSIPPHSWWLIIRASQNLASILAGWIAATVLLLVGWWFFLKRTGGRYLDELDLLLLALGAVIVGWPAIFIFLAAVFCLAIVLMIMLVIARRRTMADRLVITPAIIPAALLTLIYKTPLLALTHLDKIRF